MMDSPQVKEAFERAVAHLKVKAYNVKQQSKKLREGDRAHPEASLADKAHKRLLDKLKEIKAKRKKKGKRDGKK
jgi:hypothetical protein